MDEESNTLHLPGAEMTETQMSEYTNPQETYGACVCVCVCVWSGERGREGARGVRRCFSPNFTCSGSRERVSLIGPVC